MKLPRRQFMLGGAGLILSSAQLLAASARTSALTPRSTGGSRILVMVQLAGGNDGLNTVIPYGSDEYYRLRPSLAVKPSQVLPLTSTLGLHPRISAIHQLYNQGQIAIVPGVGYPEPSRSHFRAIEIWQTAEPERIVETGWLGRYLDRTYSQRPDESKRLFPAINIDPMLPKSLASDRIIVPSISDTDPFRFNTDAHFRIDRQKQVEAFNRIYRSYDLERPSMQLLKDVGLEAMQASEYLLKVSDKYRNKIEYPENGFGRGMKFIAQLIVAGVDTHIYNISLGGFDTHSDQLQTHPELLEQFSDTLAAFQKDLTIHCVDQDVLLMAFSEFGRRLQENDEGGTDHGTAGPVLIMGGAVKGGLYGNHPKLNDLADGDLKYSTDFRTIYATIVDRWLKADSKKILGGSFENLAFV